MLLEIAGALVLLGLGYGVGYIQGWSATHRAGSHLRTAAQLVPVNPERAVKLLNTLADALEGKKEP